MNVIGQIAAVTFGGIIPGSSHFLAVSVAARAKGDIDLINNQGFLTRKT